MKTNSIIFNPKILYIFFLFLSLNIFFFSTVKCEAKAFEIDNINISRPFEINFDKNDVIDEGFREAFSKPSSITLFLSKFISKGLDISIFSISKDLAFIFSVEKIKYI